MTAIRKILVVRLSSIGDIILTTPLLRSLRNSFPEARITFVIKKQYAELLSASPWVDELISFDSKEGFSGLVKLKNVLRLRKFDLYLDIHKNWRSRFLGIGLKAGHIATYNKLIINRSLLIWFKWNVYKKIKPVYERYFDSVRAFGIHYDGQGTDLHFTNDKKEKVTGLLKANGYLFNRPLVVICPSATYTNKRWSRDGFIQTAKELILLKSVFLAVLGGKDDRDLCETIVSALNGNAVNMAGLLSLSESAALLSLSSLVIANDSGLLHMAQSQKKPVIGIYGPTTRELGYFPVEQESTVIEVPLYCRPCTHNGLNYCPQKHFRCMNDISSELVIKAALQYIP